MEKAILDTLDDFDCECFVRSNWSSAKVVVSSFFYCRMLPGLQVLLSVRLLVMSIC